MESIATVVFGLGLRAVVGRASKDDFKIAAPLVGVWEGVVTLHFLRKRPSSFDPYVAYAVRMFIDFLVTDFTPKWEFYLVQDPTVPFS